jgi:hypothetical protein
MPARINSRKINSDTVQGTDSFVVVKTMTVAQFNRNASIFARAQQGNPAKDDLEKESRELYSEIVLDWNWVFDKLTMLELSFIGEQAAIANTLPKKNETK